MTKSWQAVVLAAGRGPDDPMAKAYGALHKCALDIAGQPMLRRVVDVLIARPDISNIAISIDDKAIAQKITGDLPASCHIVQSSATAATSALAAVEFLQGRYPILLTTGDHPLLTQEMLDYFMHESERSGADLCAGLASAETILSAFPQAKRTFLKFGKDRVSGCNLYALMNEHALPALHFWSELEHVRKKPWRLVSAFGVVPLLRFATGITSLKGAFELASRRLGLIARPILMPFAEASIDVDKPADKDLVETILKRRENSTSPPPSAARR